MKNYFRTDNQSKNKKAVFIIWLVCILLHISFNALAQNPVISFTTEAARLDEFISKETKVQLLECKNMLNYPKSVERFYKETAYKLAWVTKQNHNRQLAPAMMLLDCISQYGLNRDDFHSYTLLYKQIEILAEQPDMLSGAERTIFDVMMTDAMITFMNHLHYEKYNAELPASRIDEGGFGDFNAELKLSQLMESKDFYNDISLVQPLSKEYADLQRYMHLVRGQYLEDSYEFPEKSVRKMTINMERLRWISAQQKPALLVNIPSFIAKFKTKDTTHIFKIIVGAPSTLTPVLESKITHFTTAPERRVPYNIFVRELLPKALKDANYLNNNNFSIYNAKGTYIEINTKKLLYIKANPKQYFATQSSGCENAMGKLVFRFANPYNIFLHGTPQTKMFLLKDRAISHGCIRIEKIEKLAELILRADDNRVKIPALITAIRGYQTKNFVLKHQLPIQITYLTCEMIDGEIKIYNDVYAQDRALEMAMYGYERLLASDLKIRLKPEL